MRAEARDLLEGFVETPGGTDILVSHSSDVMHFAVAMIKAVADVSY